MNFEKIIIRDFGEIKELELELTDKVNMVTMTVAYALAILMNNQFALMKLEEIPLKRGTYLYAEMSQGETKITAELQGFEPIAYTVDGNRLTEKQIMDNVLLTRPVREDNLTLFIARTKDPALDFCQFVPRYLQSLHPYSTCINKMHSLVFSEKLRPGCSYIIAFSNHSGCFKCYKGKIDPLRETRALGESDNLEFKYKSFLKLVETMELMQEYLKKEITKTPLIVCDLLASIDQDKIRQEEIFERTLKTGRQVFFVEENK